MVATSDLLAAQREVTFDRLRADAAEVRVL